MSVKVRWEDMFLDELEAAMTDHPVVYLTFGLCEPHGLHNAVGLDGLKAHELACRAAQAHGGVVAPAFFWHVHETGYHAPWGAQTIGDRNPWLTDLPPWVLYKVYLFQLRTLAARGFHAAMVITGHYGGNEQDFKTVSDIFMRHSPLRIWAGADYEAIDYEDFHGDHAGRCETSQLWALRPEMVDISRLAHGSGDEISHIMATGPDAGRATRRNGDGIIASQIAWLGRKADELLAAYQPPARSGSPTPGNPLGTLTFNETELLWRTEVEPLLDQFTSMNLWEGQEPTDPASPWATNEQSRLR